VNQRERVRLLFGPYTAPHLKKGDRAVCLLRGCSVVTNWTDGRISWPRCRALGAHGGGSGLLLDEELARAVRHEAAAAVMHWWGVGVSAVWSWRKALGVGRTDNPGTARLNRAASEAGAAAVLAREWSEQERERRRQLAFEQGSAARLVPGHHGPWWSDADVALLGELPDDEVARRTGRTAGAVRQKRESCASPTHQAGAGPLRNWRCSARCRMRKSAVWWGDRLVPSCRSVANWASRRTATDEIGKAVR
jgi:hypothetical protein